MVIFFIKGRPAEFVDEETIVVATPAPELIEESRDGFATEVILEVTTPSLRKTEVPVKEAVKTDSETIGNQLPKTAETTTKPKAEINFTLWMAPLALDNYIRAKTDRNGRTFWENGHWITAVEGRWNNNRREFRIAYDTIPEIETWQWRYKVNQSQTEFALSVTEMVEKGYTLVQTQTFRQPGGDQRYQGVWHRQLARPTVAESAPAQNVVQDTPAPALQQAIAPSSGTSAATTPEPRGLNVNRLNFR